MDRPSKQHRDSSESRLVGELNKVNIFILKQLVIVIAVYCFLKKHKPCGASRLTLDRPGCDYLDDVLMQESGLDDLQSCLRHMVFGVAVEAGAIGPAYPGRPQAHDEALPRVIRIAVFEDADLAARLADAR